MKTDYEIQDDVMNQLKWNPFLRSSEIGVAVKEGIVTLSGHVDSYSKKIQAEECAKKVSGVRAVAEDILVGISPSFQKTDTELASAVLEALKWNSSVEEKDIKVKVENGVVTLEGMVEWDYQRKSAKNAVSILRGVKNVIDRLSLKTKATTKDIQQKITSAFHRTASVDANNIEVEVLGSRAILRGKVRSFAEKDDAEDAAWGAPGIASVENNLTVAKIEETAFEII